MGERANGKFFLGFLLQDVFYKLNAGLFFNFRLLSTSPHCLLFPTYLLTRFISRFCDTFSLAVTVHVLRF